MLKRGQIVKAKAGRDKDSFLVVLEDDGKFLTLCDGHRRSLENPKKKKLIHTTATGTVLPEEDLGTNRRIRKALKQYQDASDIMEC